MISKGFSLIALFSLISSTSFASGGFNCSLIDHSAKESDAYFKIQIPINEERRMLINKGGHNLWFVNGGESIIIYVYKTDNGALINYLNLGWGTVTLKDPELDITCSPEGDHRREK